MQKQQQYHEQVPLPKKATPGMVQQAKIYFELWYKLCCKLQLPKPLPAMQNWCMLQDGWGPGRAMRPPLRAVLCVGP